MQRLARYAGKCQATGKRFNAGDLIDYDKATKKVVLVAKNRSESITLFNEGKASTFYRNARGRCEDAPCCGCCTI